MKFHTNSVKLFSRENCLPFLIIRELKICVITGIQILNRYFHSGQDRMCEIQVS